MEAYGRFKIYEYSKVELLEPVSLERASII